MNDSIELTLRSRLETGGFIAVRIERMPEGGSNRLLKVTLGDERIVVARIAKFGKAKFRMERALMTAAIGGGIPVPAIIDLINEESGPPILLSAYVAGTTLDDVARNFDRHQLSKVASEIGRTLAKIHALNLGTGYGNLDDDLQGAADFFVHWFIGDLEPVVLRVKEALHGDALAAAGLERAVSFIGENKNLLTDNDSVLLHGDYRPENLLFDGLELVGVIDWEAAKRGPAVLDFAWWDWATRQAEVPIESQDLIPGYLEIHSLELSTFDALKRVALARIAIGHLDWAMRAANKNVEGGARLALRRFESQN